MGYVVVTPPVGEPVSLAEAKAQVRVDVDFTEEDAFLTTAIQVARERVEVMLRRSLFTTTWRLSLDRFPRGGAYLTLPRPPLQSVTSISYYDAAGSLQTMPAADYEVDTDREPGRLQPVPNKVWPVSQDDRLNAVQVTFVAGYGGTAASVPAAIRKAILLLLAHDYEHREGVLVGTGGRELPMGVREIVWNYRWGSYPS